MSGLKCSIYIYNYLNSIHYSLFRRGTAEKLRDQVKEAFSLPDAPQVLGPTLNFVGGTFEAEDSFLTVSWFNIMGGGVCTCTCTIIHVNIYMHNFISCIIIIIVVFEYWCSNFVSRSC